MEYVILHNNIKHRNAAPAPTGTAQRLMPRRIHQYVQ
nr:MAG TPA: hypothetical protein [Caudoviricetes sp.]